MYVHIADEVDLRRCTEASDGTMDFEKNVFPTIVAETDDRERILGFLSTWVSGKDVIAGPLWINPNVRGLLRGRVTLAVFECYEFILRKAGLSYYKAYVPAHLTRYISLLYRAVDLEPYDMDDNGNLWFERRLDGSSLSQRSAADSAAEPRRQ
ncbi:MAG: hypothetical protein C5B59_17320 [Bacteroidetes bacterium]|nr:MAG: hypothetical protein C5B59_17320 [Bacteroidota bacterium]